MAWTKVGETSDVLLVDTGCKTITLPGTVQQDDIVVIGVGSDISCENAISTSGYTIIDNTTSTLPGIHLGWKRMGATPDTTVCINYPSGNRRSVIIQIWRGADTTTAIDNGETSATDASGMPDAASHTTSTNAALRILFGSLDDDDVESSVTVPSGYSNLVAKETGGGAAGNTIMIASKEEATAGADDPAAFGGSGSDDWKCWHFALRPTAAVGEPLPAFAHPETRIVRSR